MLKYVLCVAGGVGAGYFIAHKKMEEYYRTVIKEETESIKEYYERKSEEKFASATQAMSQYSGIAPSVATQELVKAARVAAEREYDEAKRIVEELEQVTNPVVKERLLSAFDKEEPASEVVVDAPIQRQAKPDPVRVDYNSISTPKKIDDSPAEPEEPISASPVYEIEVEPFVDDMAGYDQFSITYFHGDDVLANESDEPIVGKARQDILTPEIFGKLNEPGRVVIYLRNDETKQEFEITRSEGKYSEEVHNQTE